MKTGKGTTGKTGRVSLLILIFAYIGLIVADPATSPFYAIESALGTVGYALIVPTMLFVIAVAVSVSILMRCGIKGRYVFAATTFGFMILVLFTVFLPVLPNAKELMPLVHNVHIPDTSALEGFAMIGVILFGAVRGFALLTGFEASVAGLSHESDKPRWVRISMGIGTVIMVLAFTSLVTYDIANTTKILELEPSHKSTLFHLWTRSKLVPGGVASQLLTFFSVGILLSGSASGAVAGSGMLRTLVRSKALPPFLSNPAGTDYRSIFLVHGAAVLLTLLAGANELIIVSFYAISVLVGFLFSLTAAVKFAYYTRTPNKS